MHFCGMRTSVPNKEPRRPLITAKRGGGAVLIGETGWPSPATHDLQRLRRLSGLSTSPRQLSVTVFYVVPKTVTARDNPALA